MGAEGTFIHAGRTAVMEGAIKLFANLDVFISDFQTGIIRTCHGTIATSHTQFIVHHHDAIVQLMGGTRGADTHARRVIAVVAQTWQEATADFTTWLAENHVMYIGAPPVFPNGCLIFDRAGGHTRIAAYASIEVNDHCIMLTHNRSPPV
jgi:hypothetical protein